MDGNTSRYLIYHLLHKKVFIRGHGGTAKGIVHRVYRNVMDNKVEIRVGRREMAFNEPNVISSEGSDIVFVYGRAGLVEDNDDFLFAEMRAGSNTGESLDDVVKRTAPIKKRETRFSLEPVVA
jgi:hypothetical protein